MWKDQCETCGGLGEVWLSRRMAWVRCPDADTEATHRVRTGLTLAYNVKGGTIQWRDLAEIGA